jgi:hypothetical protein
MKSQSAHSSGKTFACETCAVRKKSEANPRTLMARLWRWHTGWCPGWKAYQASLANRRSGPAFDAPDRLGPVRR